MIDEKWEDNVFMMAKHKLLEAIEKRNKESYHTEGDIRAYKDALRLCTISLALRRASNSGVSVVLKDLRTVINVGLLSLSNRLSK